MDFNIFLTDSAKQHFSKLLKENDSIYLGLKKSGCSGYSYVLNVIEDKEKKSKIYDGVKFIIPEENINALNNTVIDYTKEDKLNQKIVFDNPNVINGCGCGESFSIKGA